jgi:hypothetical protein
MRPSQRHISIVVDSYEVDVQPFDAKHRNIPGFGSDKIFLDLCASFLNVLNRSLPDIQSQTLYFRVGSF